jgi:hypothetical protein
MCQKSFQKVFYIHRDMRVNLLFALEVSLPTTSLQIQNGALL